jgi:hypothetical protein
VIHTGVSMHPTKRSLSMAAGALMLFVVSLQGRQEPSPAPMSDEDVRFRSGVELINVTATVSDQNGRFVSGHASPCRGSKFVLSGSGTQGISGKLVVSASRESRESASSAERRPSIGS